MATPETTPFFETLTPEEERAEHFVDTGVLTYDEANFVAGVTEVLPGYTPLDIQALQAETEGMYWEQRYPELGRLSVGDMMSEQLSFEDL